jgi:DNA polymerase IV
VTFPTDLTDPMVIADQLASLARDLCTEITNDGRQATHVAVTVRSRTFFTQVKSAKLPEATTDKDLVEDAARRILARFMITRPVRLLGVRLDLAPL